MPTATQLLDLARGQIGTGEQPPGSNQTPYTAWYGMVGPWCAMFASWCAAGAGLPEIHFAWCDTGASQFRSGAWGTWHTAGPAPGDLIFWSDGSPNLAHVSIVETVTGEAFTSIDGNWGDRVTRVTRAEHEQYGYRIAGYGRPHYTATGPSKPQAPPGTPNLTQGSTGPAVAALQTALNALAHCGLDVDGIYGPLTAAAVAAFQRFFRLDVDGIYGPQTAAVLAYCLQLPPR